MRGWWWGYGDARGWRSYEIAAAAVAAVATAKHRQGESGTLPPFAVPPLPTDRPCTVKLTHVFLLELASQVALHKRRLTHIIVTNKDELELRAPRRVVLVRYVLLLRRHVQMSETCMRAWLAAGLSATRSGSNHPVAVAVSVAARLWAVSMAL